MNFDLGGNASLSQAFDVGFVCCCENDIPTKAIKVIAFEQTITNA